MPRLASSSAKLARADEHIECLVGLIQEWIDKKPYTVVHEDNTQMTERVWHLHFAEIPDYIRWGTILGDAVHNLRSCLDHIAWQAAGGDDNAPERTEFPIFWDRQIYGSEGRNKIKGIESDPYRTIIEEAQPWKNTNGYKDDPLWRLHELDRIDKHRIVHPIVSPPLGITGNVRVIHADGRDHLPPIISQFEPSFEQHTKVMSVIADAPFLEVQVNTNIRIGIGLRLDSYHLGGVSKVLSEASERVREVTEQFRDAGL